MAEVSYALAVNGLPSISVSLYLIEILWSPVKQIIHIIICAGFKMLLQTTTGKISTYQLLLGHIQHSDH